MKQKQKRIQILPSIIVVAILGVFIVIRILSIERIPNNPEGTVGNTAGNLNNKGYFCESDGMIYFANAYDHYHLYSMNLDESNMQKLRSAPVESINAGGDYLYFYQSDSSAATGLGFIRPSVGLYRMNQNGKHLKCLAKEGMLTVTLVNDTLYYQNFNAKGCILSKTDTLGSEKTLLYEYVINPASVQNNLIYFNGTQDDHYLYTLNTADDSISVLWRGNIWNPVIAGDYIYYMDILNEYRLCRYSLSQDHIEILTEDRVDSFNIYEDMIYYLKSSGTSPALMRMHTNGSNPEEVASGIFENINITSAYVYFNTFGQPTPVYKTSTFGPVDVVQFTAAENAALDHLR